MNPFERTFQPSAEAKPETAPSTTIPHKAQTPNGEAMNVEDSTTSVLEKIKAYKATRDSGKSQKFSKRIVLGSHHDIQSAVCKETGIVYALMMPAVPGFAMLVESPFASYANCRGMASKGTTYLSRLDAQILSGILLTLASNYHLFRFQPSDSGAQKNALLRTVDREVLINAIVFIEHWVNSGNAMYIPKLSLILDAYALENGLNYRMKEWLKTAVDAVYRPDRESYEEAVTVKRSISVPTISKAKKEAAAARKEFKDWRKEAKEDILALFNQKLISFKAKTYLIAVLTEENIAAADPGTIDLLCLRLTSTEDSIAMELADQIKYFHSKLASSITTDWDDEAPNFSAGKVGDSLKTSESEAEPQTSTIDPITSKAQTEASPEAKGEASSMQIESPDPKASSLPAKSFLQLLKEKKALQQAALKAEDDAARATNNAMQENNDAPF